MTVLNHHIYQRVLQQRQAMQTWRRQIHRQPELGFQEKKTAALVAKVLNAAGWKVKTQVAQTGVVGLLKGKNPGPVIAIRADMDALPIQEQTCAAYASQNENVMHACGHDGNTAMALGAATVLPYYAPQLNGSVKIIFQPCEEVPPGGAQAMIRAGVLASPQVSAILAGHVDTSLPVGTIGVQSGAVMAAADSFTLTIQGKGGHGALPHRSVDAIAIAGQIITNIQHVVSRETDPLGSVVVSIGTIAGGSAYNILAGQVVMQGTIRTLNDQQRRTVPQKLKRIASAVAQAHRGRAVFQVNSGHPALMNHSGMTQQFVQSSIRILGRSKVKILQQPIMSGEDFTYFARKVPACFFRVGVGDKKRYSYPWHHPQFDFDEKGLVAGAAVMVQTVMDYLGYA